MASRKNIEKELLKNILKKEEKIKEKEEKKIVEEEKKIERLIEKRFPNRIYKDILEWKLYIWENCQYRREIEKKKEFDFYCNFLKRECRFEPWPRNIRK